MLDGGRRFPLSILELSYIMTWWEEGSGVLIQLRAKVVLHIKMLLNFR